MKKKSDLGGGVWAFFTYQVFSDLIKGTFTLATTRIGTILLTFSVLSYAWYVLGPEKKSLDSVRRAVADAAVAQAFEKLPHEKSIYRVAVLPFERDYTSYVTDSLRRKLSESGRYNVRDKGVFAKFWQRIRFDPREVTGADAALKAGKRLGVDAVVYGSVPEFAQTGAQAGLLMNVAMLRVPGGEKLAEFTVQEGLSKNLASPGYVESQLRDTGLLGRVILFILACLILPVLFSFAVSRVTRWESNLWNLLMLLGFVLADLVLALLILNINLTSIRGLLTMLFILGLAAVYNFSACTRIDDLAK